MVHSMRASGGAGGGGGLIGYRGQPCLKNA